MTPGSTPFSAASRRIGLSCVVLVIIGALITISGWIVGSPRLTDWLGSGISIMPNTAIAILLSGIALGCFNNGYLLYTKIFATISGAIGLATLVEHLAGVDLGIDQLVLAAEWGQRGTVSPGRMGLPASTMFVLLNTSIVLATFGVHARKFASVGAAICIAICFLSVIGFLYGAERFYVVPELTAISLTTAVLIIFLSVGIITSLPDVQPMRIFGEASAAGAMVRLALPILLIIPVLFGWLRLEGQMEGLYDVSFGVALHTILQLILLMGLLWWMASAVGERERSLRQSQEALRTAEQRYQTFIKHSAEGIWRIELSKPMDTSMPVEQALDHVYEYGELAECNDAMAKMYGFEHGEELVGARLGDLVPRSPENEEYIKAFITSGFSLQGGESEERDRFGRTVFFRNNLVGIVEDGMLARAWGTQQDITEQKRTDAALRKADRRKDDFLATLAHELRNPLAPLMSGMELLSSPPAEMEDKELQDVRKLMQRQLEHMVRLIDDLMDISRINRGKITLHFDPLELGPLLELVLGSCRPMIDNARHIVEFKIPQEPLWVIGDAVRLTQVFQNVLSNAIKYTGPGGRISMEVQREDVSVIVSIQDNGIGIAAEHLGSIFEMFSQVDNSPSRSQSGLGIGLALVKSLVAKHGGNVEARSDGLGKGTLIRVRLPLRVISSGEIPMTQPLRSQDPLEIPPIA